MPKNSHIEISEIVTQWKQELPDLASENMVLIGIMKRCSSLLNDYLEKEFNKHGLTTWQFDVLATLLRSGTPYTLTPTKLFDSLLITSGTMTTRLQKLESLGWIQRLPNPNDSRSTLVKLTDSGKTLITKVVYHHVENERKLLELLDSPTQKRLEQDLIKLLNALEN